MRDRDTQESREGRHKRRQIERKRERWGRDWERKRKTERERES